MVAEAVFVVVIETAVEAVVWWLALMPIVVEELDFQFLVASFLHLLILPLRYSFVPFLSFLLSL